MIRLLASAKLCAKIVTPISVTGLIPKWLYGRTGSKIWQIDFLKSLSSNSIKTYRASCKPSYLRRAYSIKNH